MNCISPEMVDAVRTQLKPPSTLPYNFSVPVKFLYIVKILVLWMSLIICLIPRCPNSL